MVLMILNRNYRNWYLNLIFIIYIPPAIIVVNGVPIQMGIAQYIYGLSLEIIFNDNTSFLISDTYDQNKVKGQ